MTTHEMILLRSSLLVVGTCILLCLVLRFAPLQLFQNCDTPHLRLESCRSIWGPLVPDSNQWCQHFPLIIRLLVHRCTVAILIHGYIGVFTCVISIARQLCPVDGAHFGWGSRLVGWPMGVWWHWALDNQPSAKGYRLTANRPG